MRIRRFSSVLSRTETDCGPAALATVALHYGRRVSLARLRSLIGTTSRGSSLTGIVEAAKALGFHAACMKGGTLDTDAISLPFIAHYSDTPLGHYVVVHSIKAKTITVTDPSHGLQNLTMEDFFHRWSGVLLLLTPASSFASFPQPSSSTTLSRVHALLRNNYPAFVAILTLAITAIGFSYTFAFLLKVVIDKVLPAGQTSLLRFACIAASAALIVRSIVSLVKGILTRALGDRIETLLASRYLNNTIIQPLECFARGSAGDFYSRLNDAFRTRQTISLSLPSALTDVVFALASCGILIRIDWHLSIVVILYLVGTAVIGWAQAQPIYHSERIIRLQHGRFTSMFMEAANCIRTIKGAGAEQYVLANLQSAYISAMKTISRRESLADHYNVSSTCLSNACTLTLIYIGARLALVGHLTSGSLLFCYASIALFFASADKLAMSVVSLFEGLTAIERITDELSEAPPEEYPGVPPRSMNMETALLELVGVSFSYEKAGSTVTDCSLVLNKGEVIAIRGSTGSGKSTLANIAAGLYLPTSGMVKYHGQPIGTLTKAERQRLIGIVFQDGQLMAGTIRENIDLGLGASDERICEAAAIAEIDSYIQTLPRSYDTPLGAQGMTLSSGQRQRIALARAVLRNPLVLILDEATSNLDMETEERVMNNLLSRRTDRGTIIISHRPSVVALADRVINVNEGRLVIDTSEMGTNSVHPLLAVRPRWRSKLPEQSLVSE